MVRHSVNSIDATMLMSSSAEPLDDSVYTGPYKFPFILPSDSFNLCYYTSQVPVPPILGFYQLVEERSQLKTTVNLKLHESIEFFEYCKARIPFFKRGPISLLEYKVMLWPTGFVPREEPTALGHCLGTSFFQLLHLKFQSTSTYVFLHRRLD